MSALTPPICDFFTVTDFALDCGQTLKQAKLAYRVSGDLRKPVIVSCSAFSQTYADLSYLYGKGQALNPSDYCLVHTELLGNGRSQSPSHACSPVEFPRISIADNIRLQKHCLDQLGIRHVKSVIGASMGGQQALQWAVDYPDFMDSIVVIVGSAKATLHVQLFLHSLSQAMRSDPDFNEGRYTTPPYEGLARMSEYWAPWAFSPQFFSEGQYQLYEDTSALDLTFFLKKWRTRYFSKDANDLLCHLMTWSTHDVSNNSRFNGHLDKALNSIKAKVLYLPCSTDAYFSVADIRAEASMIPDSTVSVIESVNGHAAGFGRSVDDRMFINNAAKAFLND